MRPPSGCPPPLSRRISTCCHAEARSGLTEEDIRVHCRSVMAKFMVPAIVTILEEMPRTVTGKPEKGKLAALSV